MQNIKGSCTIDEVTKLKRKSPLKACLNVIQLEDFIKAFDILSHDITCEKIIQTS